MPFVFLKILTPIQRVKNFFTDIMIKIGEVWIAGNSANMRLTQSIRWDVQGLEGLSKNKSYFIFSNHQSWMDIVILQHIFNRKIPFIRFFLKQELIYVPILGAAWWGLDFPFMKRHSAEFLSKHPERRRDDLESIRRACQIFKGRPVCILNFLEGTRFSEEKRQKSASMYQRLLSPKAGGVSYVLDAMGEQFDSILDVTLFYPKGVVSLWQAFHGKMPEVKVRVRSISVPNFQDKGQLKAWLSELWADKDQMLGSLDNTQ